MWIETQGISTAQIITHLNGETLDISRVMVGNTVKLSKKSGRATVRIALGSNVIREIFCKGVSSVVSKDTLRGDQLLVEVSAISSVDLLVSIPKVGLSVSSAAKAKIGMKSNKASLEAESLGELLVSGSCGEVYLLANSTKLDARDLAVNKAYYYMIGRGEVAVPRSGNLVRVYTNTSWIKPQELVRNTAQGPVPVIANSDPSYKEEVPTSRPEFYALIIGVDTYPQSQGKIQRLKRPVLDCRGLYDVLMTNYGFTPERSRLLLNPTRIEVITELESLAKRVTSRDNLLVFFAGHGVWDDRIRTGYWLPSDSELDNKGNWLANSTIRDYLSGIQSKHTLLISDACFSGSIFRTREVHTISDYGLAKVYGLPSRTAMTSGTLTTVPDESKFMEYLLRRLKENEDDQISARQLFQRIEVPVLNNTNAVPQYGVIQDAGDEGGDFIFIRRRNP